MFLFLHLYECMFTGPQCTYEPSGPIQIQLSCRFRILFHTRGPCVSKQSCDNLRQAYQPGGQSSHKLFEGIGVLQSMECDGWNSHHGGREGKTLFCFYWCWTWSQHCQVFLHLHSDIRILLAKMQEVVTCLWTWLISSCCWWSSRRVSVVILSHAWRTFMVRSIWNWQTMRLSLHSVLACDKGNCFCICISFCDLSIVMVFWMAGKKGRKIPYSVCMSCPMALSTSEDL